MTSKIYWLRTILVLATALVLSCSKNTNVSEMHFERKDESLLGIKMINTTKVFYYGDRNASGIYNYFLGLCDMEFDRDEDGNEIVPKGGSLVFFDIYSSIGAKSSSNAVLPNGTYTLSADNISGCMSSYCSRLQVFKDGQQVSIGFVSGVLNVSDSPNGKLLMAEFKTVEGESFKCYYDGALEFGNPNEQDGFMLPVLSESVDEAFIWASGVYYGDEYNSNIDRFILSLATASPNSNGVISTAGYNILLSVFTNKVDGKIFIEPGTYYVNSTYEVGTIESGEYITDYEGSYCVKADNSATAIELSFIAGGTVSVKNVKSCYIIEMNLVTTEGTSIKGTYEGRIVFKDMSSNGSTPNTTLKKDYVLDLKDAYAELIYYGDFYKNKKDNWVLSIINDEGDVIDIDIITEQCSLKTMFPIPECSKYEMSVNKGVGIVAGMNDDKGMSGTWYIDLSTIDINGFIYGYAAAIDGYFIIFPIDRGSYYVKFEFLDEVGNTFSGVWTGVIPPAIDKSKSSAPLLIKNAGIRKGII